MSKNSSDEYAEEGEEELSELDRDLFTAVKRNYAAAVASDLCHGLTTESSSSASSNESADGREVVAPRPAAEAQFAGVG